jgi:hypothetical protein
MRLAVRIFNGAALMTLFDRDVTNRCNLREALRNGLAKMTNDPTHPDPLPLAHASATDLRPISNVQLLELTSRFSDMSVAQSYLGPAWVNDDGVACIVFIAHDARKVKQLIDERGAGVLAWIWDNTPSMYLSLTLLQKRDGNGPKIRWMCPSDDPIVESIRLNGSFFMTIVGPRGERGGWHDVKFNDAASTAGKSPLLAFRQLWDTPRSGIPDSDISKRYVPFQYESHEEGHGEPIPLWADATADFWRTINYEGPWAADLTTRDKAMAEWGYHAWHRRHRAAGFIEVLLDRTRLDGQPPLFRDDGELFIGEEIADRVHQLIIRYPLLGEWLAALAGPSASAQRAHDAAISVLADPPSVFALLDKLFGILSDIDDEVIGLACQFSFEAALIDPRITKEGTRRPWLANSKDFAINVKTIGFVRMGGIAKLARVV